MTAGDDNGEFAMADRPMAPTLDDLMRRRYSRRLVLAGLAGSALGVTAAPWWPSRAAAGTTLVFTEIDHAIGVDHGVAPGYRADILIRWGDAIRASAPAFAPGRPTVAAQKMQFGYNNDYVAFLPLPRGSRRADHGLLCVNHEYTDRALIWPNTVRRTRLSRAQMAVEMAAHGISVVEIRKQAGRWRVIVDSRFNRRITTDGTAIRIAGPAAGHPRLRTAADPAGTRVIGTLANCSGGTTPWGTVLSAEENFDGYFGGVPKADGREAAAYRRYGIDGGAFYDWYRYERRFDLGREPNEPNRFGWIVEYDPYAPDSMPVKRTALGRFKHEGARTVLSADGRLVVYSGDDERFQYIYRFVSRRRAVPDDPVANRDLLDDGVLSVARFADDGTMEWRALVFGRDGLGPEAGFASQADVLIEARRAAQLRGATPMDRPEVVAVDPTSGRVYAVLTKNARRTGAQIDAANPRADNRYGHILELIPPAVGTGLDHAAARFRWDVFLLAGNPRRAADGARYHPGVSTNGWLAAPDNITFDPKGRLWIATDQGHGQRQSGVADGLYACDTEGPGRALTRFFYKVPIGAEATGPCFTPDGQTLFVAVQHPGEGSTFARPDTRWPDFDDSTPPRPAVVAITREDGSPIGG